jgi:ABC-type nickel/cobalt efflux system permease component RcnA
MPVIATTRRPLRRWQQWWPLALFILFALGAALWLWHIWPQVLRESVSWQRGFNRQMSALIQAVAENPTAAGGSLLLVSLCMAYCMRWGRGMEKW